MVRLDDREDGDYLDWYRAILTPVSAVAHLTCNDVCVYLLIMVSVAVDDLVVTKNVNNQGSFTFDVLYEIIFCPIEKVLHHSKSEAGRILFPIMNLFLKSGLFYN